MGDYCCDPGSAGDCVLQLPADDCGLSWGRRKLYGCDGESGGGAWTAGGGGSDDRLHFDGGGGNFSGRDCADVGGAEPATSHFVDMPGDSCVAGDCESARREGHGNGVYSADVFVCGDAAGADRGWVVEDEAGRSASDTGCSVSCDAAGYGGHAGSVDAAEGVCERMRGDD